MTHRVDQRVVGAHEHGVRAVEHEARGGPVVAEVFAQVLDRGARGLELHARVEQVLDHLEAHEVAVRVAALRATPPRVGERRAHEVGARPVVELAVRDADELAHLRTAVAHLLRRELEAGERRLLRGGCALRGLCH